MHKRIEGVSPVREPRPGGRCPPSRVPKRADGAALTGFDRQIRVLKSRTERYER